MRLVVRIPEWTHAEVEIVLIGRTELEPGALPGTFRFRSARLERGVESEVRGQIERPVVVGVVTVADVAHGCLG